MPVSQFDLDVYKRQLLGLTDLIGVPILIFNVAFFFLFALEAIVILAVLFFLPTALT